MTFDASADTDRQIFLKLHGHDLYTLPLINKYISGLCDNAFWQTKFIQEYELNIGDIQNINYRDAYKELYFKDLNLQLIWASEKGYTTFVTELLKRGANIHIFSDFPLRIAVKYKHLDTVKLLIDNGANMDPKLNGPYVAQAAKNRGIKNLNCLLYRPIVYAVKRGYFIILKILLEKDISNSIRKESALIVAACNGHYKIVELLLDYGANVNNSNDMALSLASRSGHINIVALLLARGATNYHGALLHAIEGGHSDIANLFYERGEVFNINNETLVYAIQNNLLNVAMTCLNKGMDIHYDNDVLLRYAVAECNLEMVKMLLAKGIGITTVDGLLMYRLLRSGGRDRYTIYDLLVNKGVSVNNKLYSKPQE